MAAGAVRDNHQHTGRKNHIVPDTDGKLVGPTKVSLDYMYLHEWQEKRSEGDQNPPHLVTVEHKHGRVWAYRAPNKCIHAEAPWLPKRIAQDWDNVGFKDIAIQLRTDQEPSIVQLQSAIQTERAATMIPINSPVGESECNGRVENAIRRAREKIRTLRHQVETNTKRKIQDNAPIMVWMVRWVAEVISKYIVGGDRKSLYERI